MLPKAERELYKAWKYYEEEQPGLGKRFGLAFTNKLEFVQKNPFHYPLKNGFREALVDKFPYLIVYKVIESRNIIYVTSVFHTSRHPKRKHK